MITGLRHSCSQAQIHVGSSDAWRQFPDSLWST